MLALFYLGRKERDNCGVHVLKLICSFNIFIAAGVVVERVHPTAAAAVLLPLAGLVVVVLLLLPPAGLVVVLLLLLPPLTELVVLLLLLAGLLVVVVLLLLLPLAGAGWGCTWTEEAQ